MLRSMTGATEDVDKGILVLQATKTIVRGPNPSPKTGFLWPAGHLKKCIQHLDTEGFHKISHASWLLWNHLKIRQFGDNSIVTDAGLWLPRFDGTRVVWLDTVLQVAMTCVHVLSHPYSPSSQQHLGLQLLESRKMEGQR